MIEENINHLIEKSEVYLRENRYADFSISKHKSLWKRGIAKYMESRHLKIYSPSIGDECLCHLASLNKYTDGSMYEFRRSIRVLNDMLILGYIRRTSREPIKHDLEGAIGQAMALFITHQRHLRRADKTVGHHQRNLSYFLEYLTKTKKLASPSEITEGDIVAYLEGCENKSSARNSIRMLMGYWYANGIIQYDFKEFFQLFKVRHKERIPSFYSHNDVEIIEASVNKNYPVGKRDYAIILLASRLGLRASDISSLTFDEIDWENNLIRKRTAKTCTFIELPLLPEVGNAIIDYLKNGRPSSNEKKIFLMHKPPYLSLSTSAICSKINLLIRDSGVEITDRHHGVHSLRHSLASALLSEATPINTISEILGHRSIQSTMCYLSIDIDSLRECALEVPRISETFYNQKGGYFYERH